jgi:polyisoprenoid-binding protein YceI
MEQENPHMNRTTRITALALAMAPALAFGQAATWNVDSSHTRAGFSVKHLVISDVKGEFAKTEGKAQIDESDLAKSSVEVTIDAASIDTRDAKRDAHLKSADFFDVAKFPTITFKSTKVVPGKDGAISITGDLTMHGVTKPVTLDGELSKTIVDPWGNTRRGVTLTGKLDRKAWGISWGKVTDVGAVVGDEVKLDIQAEIVKEQAKK